MDLIFWIWKRTVSQKPMNDIELTMVESIRKKSWQQGDFFPSDVISAPEFSRVNRMSDDSLYIAMSQSCDMLHGSLENEPVIEILQFYPVKTGGGEFEKGRHPRCYRLLVYKKPDGSKCWYETNVRERYSISRHICARYSPDPDTHITTTEIRSIAHWLASRYTRPALPDAFNKRLGKSVKKIRKILQKHSEQDATKPSDFLSFLFLNVQNEELPEHEIYNVSLLGSMKLEDYVDQKCRGKTFELIRNIEAEMNQCRNINVKASCRCEQQISLHDLRRYRRWFPFDDLSYET